MIIFVEHDAHHPSLCWSSERGQ